MATTIKEVPEDYVNVMVTYRKEFRYGPYGDSKRTETVTRLGFYSSMFGNYAMPEEWRSFKGSYLPHGFNGDRRKPEEIIDWKPCKNNS